MRTIFSFMMASVDGYHEEVPARDFDWPVVDADFNEMSARQLDEADTLVFGRVTYEGMAAYWPTPAAAEQNDSRVTARMNETAKIVVSRTLRAAEWANTWVVGDLAELAELKRQPGKAIAVLGSSRLTAELLSAGLVDELRIMLTPVLLGGGASLFHNPGVRRQLTLASVRQFESGNVLLTYRPTG